MKETEIWARDWKSKIEKTHRRPGRFARLLRHFFRGYGPFIGMEVISRPDIRAALAVWSLGRDRDFDIRDYQEAMAEDDVTGFIRAETADRKGRDPLRPVR